MRAWARRTGPRLAGAAGLLAAVLSAPPLGAQGVRVGVTPATLTVSPGAQFDLDLAVTQAGSVFNGFDVIVSYDPAALTLVPLSPTTLQEGCLMTGVCSAACGNTFHRFSAAGDSVSITDILLCNQIALVGPGQLYRLRFTASLTDQATQVRVRRAQFYDAGIYVNPVITEDAYITIGAPVGLGEPGGPPAGLGLRAAPNPMRGSTVFAIEADRAGEQRLDVHDLAGRLVRRVDRGRYGAGIRHVAWDGTDGSGARAPSGVYVVTLSAGDRTARVRVALLR